MEQRDQGHLKRWHVVYGTMTMSMMILLAGAALTAAPHFQRHEIADYPAPYQVAVAADIKGDGKLDIVVSAGRNNKLIWYENK